MRHNSRFVSRDSYPLHSISLRLFPGRDAHSLSVAPDPPLSFQQVICGKCSPNKLPLACEQNKPARVCSRCFGILSERAGGGQATEAGDGGANTPTAADRRTSVLDVSYTRGKGVLDVSTDREEDTHLSHSPYTRGVDNLKEELAQPGVSIICTVAREPKFVHGNHYRSVGC